MMTGSGSSDVSNTPAMPTMVHTDKVSIIDSSLASSPTMCALAPVTYSQMGFPLGKWKGDSHDNSRRGCEVMV